MVMCFIQGMGTRIDDRNVNILIKTDGRSFLLLLLLCKYYRLLGYPFPYLFLTMVLWILNNLLSHLDYDNILIAYLKNYSFRYSVIHTTCLFIKPIKWRFCLLAGCDKILRNDSFQRCITAKCYHIQYISIAFVYRVWFIEINIIGKIETNMYTYFR